MVCATRILFSILLNHLARFLGRLNITEKLNWEDCHTVLHVVRISRARRKMKKETGGVPTQICWRLDLPQHFVQRFHLYTNHIMIVLAQIIRLQQTDIHKQFMLKKTWLSFDFIRHCVVAAVLLYRTFVSPFEKISSSIWFYSWRQHVSQSHIRMYLCRTLTVYRFEIRGFRWHVSSLWHWAWFFVNPETVSNLKLHNVSSTEKKVRLFLRLFEDPLKFDAPTPLIHFEHNRISTLWKWCGIKRAPFLCVGMRKMAEESFHCNGSNSFLCSSKYYFIIINVHAYAGRESKSTRAEFCMQH